jgi:tetratricopeptide (TPR) repeat protein
MLARRRSHLLAVAALGTVLAVAAPALAEGTSCQELVRQARTHEDADDDDRAATRYAEALGIDAACGPAWLGLAAIRKRQGDPKEAARILALALRHLPELREASLARARALRAARDPGWEEALRAWVDGARSPAEATLGLRDLAAAYHEDGRRPAELAAWRRLLSLAEAEGDVALAREAQGTVRALLVATGDVDPVAAPPGGAPSSSLARNVMARVAASGGPLGR